MLSMLFALTTVAADPVDLSWLAGYWLTCDNGRETSETWSDMRGGTLLGTTFTFHGGEISWEHARIAPGRNGYAFFAQPKGEAVTEFRLVRNTGNEAVFENKAHDFPQRVIYRRNGNQLIGRIEGTSGGKARASEWRYRSAALNTRCWTQPVQSVPALPKRKTR